MTNHAVDDRELLRSVFRGLSVYFNYTGSAECLEVASAFSDDMMNGWNYQVSAVVFSRRPRGSLDSSKKL